VALSERETTEVATANASGREPVVLVHGLWLLAGSWDAMRHRFEEAGYATVVADWPGDPLSVSAARANPDTFAHMSVGKVTEHVAELIGQLDKEPVLIGHSFGGLIVQKLAGQGLAKATVAIDPASFRGVLATPLSSVRSIMPFLRNPANYRRSVTQTPAQFRYAMANAVSEAEAAELYETLTIPGAGRPLFQVAGANANPKTECAVDTGNAKRGPLLIICGSQDHITPASIARGAFKRQRRNPGTTEFVELDGCGHSLAFDSTSSQVAEAGLKFLERVGN
jgi:pimeloyl-ACP methyl ester carboxylesterase